MSIPGLLFICLFECSLGVFHVKGTIAIEEVSDDVLIEDLRVEPRRQEVNDSLAFLFSVGDSLLNELLGSGFADEVRPALFDEVG